MEDNNLKSLFQEYDESKIIKKIDKTAEFKTWLKKKKIIEMNNSQSNSKLKRKIGNRNVDFLKSIENKQKVFNLELKDFKKRYKNNYIIEKNKTLLQKELEEKVKKRSHLSLKYKEDHPKIVKLKIRIKDLQDFINVESLSRKVYLSDEPQLNAAGWLKLILSYMILIFWASIIIWPLYQLTKATFNGYDEHRINYYHFKFSLVAYKILFNETNYSYWLTNTIIIASATSILTVMATLLMGYAFSRYRFKGRKTSLLTIMIIQMIPTMAALTVFYVLYILLKEKFNISGSAVLIIIYVGGGIAGNTFIMKGYMDSISTEIDDAAKIDGLSSWGIFTRIITPLAKPMIALIALWSFIGPFGDIILPLMLLGRSKDFTLAIGLRSLLTNQQNLRQTAYAAGALIVALPIAILFIGLRKFMIGGITAGGVKG